jgi:hypothetical protein
MPLRKRILAHEPAERRSLSEDAGWLPLGEIATVDISSEDPEFPIEGALLPGGTGWRAGQPGKQQIRIIFDTPRSLRRIQLRFEDASMERTQQFVLSWSGPDGSPGREIVRQQWNFSPGGSTTEVEDYHVEVENLSVLELTIVPDIALRPCHARISSLRVK